MFGKTRHVHFVGVGGAGMSGIAEILHTLGYIVTGSDLRDSDTTNHLKEIGVTVLIGHDERHVAGAQVVVASTAVPGSNPEIRAAEQQRIPVIPRAEMLAELMRLKHGIAVAGAHGKTTTTSMIAGVLADFELDPTVVIGGRVNALGGHARLGNGTLLIAEADESDGTFLKLSPSIVVVTNIDREHLDYYRTFDHLVEAFSIFINNIPFYGLAVLCADDPVLRSLIPCLRKRCVTYGISHDADLTASDIELRCWMSSFTVTSREGTIGRFTIPMPGTHYIANALAAVAVGLEMDVPVPDIKKALARFGGVERRFHRIGEKSGILVIDDYAHHPTEIRATVAAAKDAWNRRLLVLFQPHRFTRTRDLMHDFGTAFERVDVLFVTEIYPAGEDPIVGVSGSRLVEVIQGAHHPCVSYVEREIDLVDRVMPLLRDGDIVLTLGAGDIWKIGRAIMEKLT